MKLRATILPLLLAISFSLSDPCAPSRQGPETPKKGDKVFEVTTIFPRFEDSPRFVASSGKFSVSDKLTVKALYDGVIDKSYVGEGDQVEVDDPLTLYKGDTISDLIEKKQLELKEVEAALQLDRKNFELRGGDVSLLEPEEGEPLFLDEEAPEKEVPKPTGPAENQDQKKNSSIVDLASKIKLDEAKIERINKELDQLEERVKKLTVTATIGGMIHKRHITDGQLVTRGDALFDIITVNPISLSFYLPEDVASYIDKLSTVRLTPLDEKESPIEGSIFYISPQIDPVKKALEVRAHFPNEQSLMKDGQSGKVIVATRKIDKLLVLPLRAVVQEADKNFIFVAYGNKVQKIEVKVGQPMGLGEVEVDANIRIDDPIVVNGAENLKDGSFVKVVSNAGQPAINPLDPPVPEKKPENDTKKEAMNNKSKDK